MGKGAIFRTKERTGQEVLERGRNRDGLAELEQLPLTPHYILSWLPITLIHNIYHDST